MRISYYVPFIVAIVNLTFRLIYATIGRMTSGQLDWVFYIFRPEYVLISWFLSFVCIVAAAGMIAKFKLKKIGIFNIIAIVLNVTYLFLFVKWMAMQ